LYSTISNDPDPLVSIAGGTGLMEMTYCGKHTGDVFTTILGKHLAGDGVSHIPTSSTAKGRDKYLFTDKEKKEFFC